MPLLEERMSEDERDITAIQEYILKQINGLRHGYTTLSRQEQNEILLGLALNWIQFQMEKEKIKGDEKR